MVLQLLESQKALNKAFKKNKANREPLECFKVNLSQFSISINENETERFSKNQNHDFITKSSYDPIYSLNISGRFITMTSIAETLIGKKIEVKTPYHIRKSISLEHTKGFTISRTIENQNFCNSKMPLFTIKKQIEPTNSLQII